VELVAAAAEVTEQETFPLFETLMFETLPLLANPIVPKLGAVLLQVMLSVPVGVKVPERDTVSAASANVEKETTVSATSSANILVCFFIIHLHSFLRNPSQSLFPYCLLFYILFSFYVPPNVMFISSLRFKKVVDLGITTRNPKLKLLKEVTPDFSIVNVEFTGNSVAQLSVVKLT
jgi:hypothetical protein